MSETPLAKVHFLFTMLNISQLFVTQRGCIIGVIAKREFLKTNRQLMDENQSSKDDEDDINEPLGTEYLPSILSRSIVEEENEDDSDDSSQYGIKEESKKYKQQ